MAVKIGIFHKIKREVLLGLDSHRKRILLYAFSLTKNIQYYAMEINIGSPAQSVEVMIDTGSVGLWINQSFSASQSSTFKFINDSYVENYVSGSVQGDWVDDTVELGDYLLQGFEFGLVNNSYLPTTGLVGIGIPGAESYAPSTNIVDALVRSKYIQTPAFSLYLKNLTTDSGELLFGGVDLGKYTGQLYSLPLVSNSAYQVNLSSISVGSTQASSQYLPVYLDSGTSFIYLPQSMVDTIGKAFGLLSRH